MKVYTWAELKAIIKSELDLDEETFVDADELRNYCNKAIDEGEQHVMLIYQDYFRKSSYLNVVAGEPNYALPGDIYANKIRHLQYNDGSNKYRMTRIHPSETMFLQGNEDYKYDLEHKATAVDTDTGMDLVIYPTPRLSGTLVRMWYIRNASRVVDDTTVIDLPESKNFIQAYIAREIALKEGSPYLQLRENELAKQIDLYKQTLDKMVPDDQELIEPDMSFYYDFNDGCRNDY